jgi:Beta-lactamase
MPAPAPGLYADSVFEIGSITKVFTAILLADMADRGEVKLDDPVAMYLPADVRIPERSGRKITLLDLSTQSSGLPRMPDNLRPSNPLNPYADYTVAQMFDFLGRYQLPRDIGAEFEYSNLGVGLRECVLANLQRSPDIRNRGVTVPTTSCHRNTRKLRGALFMATSTPFGRPGPSARDETSIPSVASALPRKTAISRE